MSLVPSRPFDRASAAPLAVTFEDDNLSTEIDALTYTHTGMILGAAAPDRVIYLTVASGRRDVVSVTVAGVSCTQVADSGSAGSDYIQSTIWKIADISNTTATIVVTLASATGSGRTQVSIFRTTGVTAETDTLEIPEAVGVASISGAISVAEGGAIIVCATERGNLTAITVDGANDVGSRGDLDSSDETTQAFITGLSANASYAVGASGTSAGNISLAAVALE